MQLIKMQVPQDRLKIIMAGTMSYIKEDPAQIGARIQALLFQLP